MTYWFRLFISALVSIGLWQLIVTTTESPRYILPSPVLVAEALWQSRVLLWKHAYVTISSILMGLGLGTVLGGLSAIGLAGSSTARGIVKPILIFSQTIPIFALAPILNSWLGYGIESKILMAVLITYFPVTSAFLDALLRTNSDWLGLAKVMNARPWRVMAFIMIPAALPGFASGLRLAAVYAPIGAIIGEWVGASKGLGYLMLHANGQVRVDLMFAAVIVLALFTILLHAIVNAFAKHVLERS